MPKKPINPLKRGTKINFQNRLSPNVKLFSLNDKKQLVEPYARSRKCSDIALLFMVD